MIVGLENLIKTVQDCKIKNFEVRTNATDSNSTQLRTNDTMTPDEKINLLRSVMGNNYGTFHLIGYESAEKTLKGRYDITFTIRQDQEGGMAGQRAVSGIGFTAPEGYLQKSEVEQMIKNVTLEYQISGLKEQMESLKKEKKELETPINEFMRNLAPIAGAIAQNFMKGQAQPSAIGELSSCGDTSSKEEEEANQQSQTEDQELNDMLNEALSRWHEVDSDCFVLIQKIADLAENDPSTYNMAKTMLMSK